MTRYGDQKPADLEEWPGGRPETPEESSWRWVSGPGCTACVPMLKGGGWWWSCTRQMGHAGDHVAHGPRGEVFHRWSSGFVVEPKASEQPPKTDPMRQQWEYFEATLSPDASERAGELAEFGDKGWELAALVPPSVPFAPDPRGGKGMVWVGMTAYFKRPVKGGE